MNKVIIIGRLTKDPVMKDLKNDLRMARFSLAVERRVNGEADFPNCAAFGKTAEFCEKYLKKGMKISIVGRLQTSMFKNRDGITIHTTDVICEEIGFMESKKAEIPEEFMAVDDNDLPFR